MADLLLPDAVWFAAHPGETHRARPATASERATFPFLGHGNPMHLTIVRAADGARACYAFPDDCDLPRACSEELAGLFDDELDSGRAEPR